MASLPSDIVFAILSQLPVKTLARFKTLNKLCGSIITDPLFIRAHFKNGAHKANDSLGLLLSYEEHRNLNSIVHFFTVRVRDIDEVAVLEYSAVESVSDGYIVLPSCNGLVCFYGLHGGVHVCNPSTKDIVRLPDIDAEGFGSLGYGFGFDEMSGKHKVIQFLLPQQAARYHGIKRLRIEIFTMGDNSWKNIGYRPPYGWRNPPVFAGGFFYWIEGSRLSIVSFDIGNEIFEDISPPEGISENNSFRTYLQGLRGELCLVDHSKSAENRMDIWFLKRGVVEKKVNWVRATIVHQSEYLGSTHPVAFNGEEILLRAGIIVGRLGNFLRYNLQTGCFRQVEINGAPPAYFNMSNHVESLFPVQ